MNDTSSRTEPSSPHGRSAFDKRVRRHVAGRMRDYFAVTAPGFEDICRRELIDLGMACPGPADETGGVSFSGRFVDCQRANLYLRSATRILLRVDTFTATNARQLTRQCAAVPWELFLPPGALPCIRATSRRSRLYHTDLITESVREGLIGRLGEASESRASDFPQTLLVRLTDDGVTLSLDSSGEPLYKRGFKPGPARAPIRESMAAGILMRAGFDAARPLVDPLCGSGTFSLEAAMMAKRMAPGGQRPFAFMAWPAFREGQWHYLMREAEAAQRQLDRPMIFASDIDGPACDRLTRRIADEGLADAVRVAVRDFFDCEAGQYGGGPGLVAINPPYGVRIGEAAAAEDLFRRIGRHLETAFSGWRVAVIVPDSEWLRGFPVSGHQQPLMHGGLSLTLAVGIVD